MPAAAEGSAEYSKEPKGAPAQHRCGDAIAAVLRDGTPKLDRGHPACQKYVKLIMDLGRAKQCGKALELLTEMRQKSIEPNVAVYTALISACDKGKQPERALELFDTMQQKGVEPTQVTFNALISACGNGQMPDKALEVC